MEPFFLLMSRFGSRKERLDEMVRERAHFLIIGVLVVFAGFACAGNIDYFIWDDWGGSWADAEKNSLNSEDDYMCWAATASNMLEWTGWVEPGLSSTDEIFAYFQDHWTDEGGSIHFALDWWFDGSYIGPLQSGWSHPDVPGGGFYSPQANFNDYFQKAWNPPGSMSIIDEYLHNGYGTGLGLYGPGAGHAVSVWGFKYDPDSPDYYTGIYLTNSDDSKGGPAPRPDVLQYYDVAFANNKWYLQDYHGIDAWFIDDILALAMNPGYAHNPEPTTILLLGFGSFALLKKKRGAN